MRLPSYAQVAERSGVRLDDWPDRRPTRSGIRRYLMLAYHEIPQDRGDEPSWLRLWAQITWVRSQARSLHVTIPPNLWAEDRARLAARLVASANDIRYPKEKLRALRWTRRR